MKKNEKKNEKMKKTKNKRKKKKKRKKEKKMLMRPLYIEPVTSLRKCRVTFYWVI
jgi:hypothetical protein